MYEEQKHPGTVAAFQSCSPTSERFSVLYESIHRPCNILYPIISPNFQKIVCRQQNKEQTALRNSFFQPSHRSKLNGMN